jgi:hypothetical protein
MPSKKKTKAVPAKTAEMDPEYRKSVQRILEGKAGTKELATMYVKAFLSGDDNLFKFLENRSKDIKQDNQFDVRITVCGLT